MQTEGSSCNYLLVIICILNNRIKTATNFIFRYEKKPVKTFETVDGKPNLIAYNANPLKSDMTIGTWKKQPIMQPANACRQIRHKMCYMDV